ncbi:hypothetical protein SCB49_01974 [unidentified eubacterium SCB49]|nr:hypothetical protein SCB49_01974 [unidentified eubacterium SCB49]
MLETFFYGKKSVIMKLNTKHILWLLAACFAVFFIHLDALPVNIMEARNFITAREILIDDNWLLTTINGEARYQKPPLPTWFTAISAKIFGLESLYALRLPAVLLASFSIYFFYRFVCKLTQQSQVAFISALILITSFYFTFAGRNGQWDIFAHGFILAAIYFLFQFFSSSVKRYHNALLAGLCIGLSFMSKGPVALYSLLLPFIIAYGLVFKFKTFQKKWLPLLLLLVVTLVLSGWWYLYTYIFDPHNVLLITDKETTNWTSYQVKPFYYYWNFFLQTGVWILPTLVSLFYPYFKNKVASKKGYTLSLIWMIAALILLTIIPAKKQRYLLPVLVPIAINIGFYIDYLFRSFSEMRRLKQTWPVFLQFGAIAIVGILFPVVAGYYYWNKLEGLWPWFILLSLSIFSGGCYILYYLYHRNIKKVFYTSIVFIAAALVFGYPLIGLLNTNPNQKDMSNLAVWEVENNIKVYEYSAFTPEFLWQYGDKMERLDKDQVKQKLLSNPSIGILVHEKALSNFKEDFKLFNIKVIDEFDINSVPKFEKKHNFRLHRYLYLVSAKQQ